MRYISVCSGIEAATVAWGPLGWSPICFSEFDKFPSAVLSYHYPEVVNHGDMTKFKEWPDYDATILVGGTPCQSFSVAGLRKGLADPRGNLMLTYLAIADRYRPRWLVWENVPGVLSSNGGRDFGTFLGALGELGYGFSYRVLDAQYFGVPQRRRRVFVVGCLGGWQRAAAVLFEQHSLSWHTAPCRETGKDITKTTSRCLKSHWEGGPHPSLTQSNNSGGIGLSNQELFSQGGSDLVNCFGGKNHEPIDVSTTINAKGGVGRIDFESETFIAFPAEMSATQSASTEDISPCLSAKHTIAFTQNQVGDVLTNNVFPSIGTNSNATGRNTAKVQQGINVRRLTPIECERLQGFPDNYTQIPWRGKQPENCPDGPRYKALGNSMAVPVMRWIGKRIAAVDNI